jgi:predicted MFS family arabinose efflux permease
MNRTLAPRPRTPSPHPPSVPAVRELRPVAALFTLWLLVFTASSQVMIMAPLLPRIGEELGVEPHLLGTLITADAMLVGIVALLMGPVSDRIGRRRVLLIGSGSLALALGLHVFATDFARLLALRGLAGAAGGMLSGAAVAYVGDAFPYARRGRANGWVMSGAAFGQIVGLPLGSVLAAAVGFRAPFLALSGLAALTLLLALRTLPQPSVQRAPEPVRPGRIVRHYAELGGRPEVRAAAAVFALLFGATALFFVYLPAWMETRFGASPGTVATMLLCGGVAAAVAGPLAGQLSDRIGRRRVIVGSCIGLAIAVSGIALAANNTATVFPLFALAMAMVAARIGPMQALLTAIVSDDRRGTMVSLVVAVGQFGFGLGAALAGAAFGAFGYAACAGAAVIAVLTAARLVAARLPDPRADGDEPDDRSERRSPARLALFPAAAALRSASE